MKTFYRDLKGRFANKYIAVIVYSLIIIAIIIIAYFSKFQVKIEYTETEKIVFVNSIQEIIDKEKNEVLDLLEQCESKGNADAINWEDNGSGKNRASFGAYMFKVGTVKSFSKDLTDFQAIALASDRDEARKLAEHIIFQTKGGIWNWLTCAKKDGLVSKVEFIKNLESKIK